MINLEWKLVFQALSCRVNLQDGTEKRFRDNEADKGWSTRDAREDGRLGWHFGAFTCTNRFSEAWYSFYSWTCLDSLTVQSRRSLQLASHRSGTDKFLRVELENPATVAEHVGASKHLMWVLAKREIRESILEHSNRHQLYCCMDMQESPYS